MRDCAGTAGDSAGAIDADAGAANLTAAWRSATDISRACSTSLNPASAPS